MKATYITHMGDDLLVVNAARVSFKKKSVWEDDEKDIMTGEYGVKLSDKDTKLISYLAKHNHWTPFAHPQICMHMKAPIFVARQLFKHKVGMTENEVSRRYVDEEPEFYIPEEWRLKADNKKQGSSKETINEYTYEGGTFPIMKNIKYLLDDVKAEYAILIKHNVAPELARMILPQNMYTEWYWTGSLAAWARIAALRDSNDAQQETRDLVVQAGEIISPLFPVSWEALTNETHS